MFMLLLSIMGIWFVVYIIKKMGDVELADAFEETLNREGLDRAKLVYVGAKTKQFMKENDKFFETGFGHNARKKEAMEMFQKQADENKFDLRNTTLGKPAYYYYVETTEKDAYGEIRESYTLKTTSKELEEIRNEKPVVEEEKELTTEEKLEALAKENEELKSRLGEGKIINDEY